VCGASLVGASLLPTALGVAGSAYLLGALLLDLFFVAYLARFARERSRQAGGRLLAASLLYLPLLLALLALDTRSPLA
jgi:heme O synthase-like polyprenyltransferase